MKTSTIRNGRWSIALAAWLAAGFAPAQTETPAYRGWVRGRDLAWTPMSAVTNTTMRYHAIVIGINNYQKPPPLGWDKLGTARQDAEAVADVLEKQYGFKVTRLFDEQATRATILAALDNLQNFTIDDAVLIYYAGHGFFEQTLNEGFWIPADAGRKSGSRSANQDWVWNSVITKIIGASPARHVLVISDSCYGGSLFRGGGPDSVSDPTWYVRAVTTPSRYLITSGDLEPVLDSGGQHSIFCQSLLNILQYPPKPIFSASDVGVALREKVSTLTSQMPRMGPLSVASHAGGEFVFVTKDAPALPGVTAGPEAGAGTRGGPGEAPAVAAPVPEARPPAPDDQQLLRDVALLAQQGATNACQSLLSLVTPETRDSTLGRAVTAYADQQRERERRNELQNLISRLEQRKKEGSVAGAKETGAARPRILACIGPEPKGGGTDAEAEALVCRISLRSALEEKGGVIVVERDALATVLQEMDIGSSELADPRARTEIGKLLPASVLMMGDLVQSEKANTLFVRLVDTETTRVLGSFTERVATEADLSDACGRLASGIEDKMRKVRPLQARVLHREGDQLTAGIGSFHGIAPDAVLDLVERKAGAGGSWDGPERKVGSARLASVGESESTLTATWEGEVSHNEFVSLWVRERAAAPVAATP